jgi:hypothetical protein
VATGPLVSVIDAALPAPLFRRLARAVRRLGAEGLRATYRTTFWYALGAPAALPEEAIAALLPRLPRRGRGIEGVEWWLSRMRTSDVQVDFHRDRDEALFARRGIEVHPAFTAVLFLNRCRGGLLAVTDAPPDETRPARAPDTDALDLVRPWPNRLAVLPGGATHGVLDARGRIPDGRLARPTPLRLAVIVNGWPRRPERVPGFAAAGQYASLATGPGAPSRRG